MIDPTIRARLLAMPAEYREASASVVAHVEGMSLAKVLRDEREAAVTAALAVSWAESKGNESIRKAQAEAGFRADEEWGIQSGTVLREEMALRRAHVTLDCLRFESVILIAVANNDGPLVTWGRTHDGD